MGPLLLAAQLVLSAGLQAAAGIVPSTMQNGAASVVEVAYRAPELSTGAAAYHLRGDDHIYILTDTAVYHAAQAGDPQALKMLAGIIAHEHTHVLGGDERAAYAMQLQVLKAIGASSDMIQEVQRARDSVVKGR